MKKAVKFVEIPDHPKVAYPSGTRIRRDSDGREGKIHRAKKIGRSLGAGFEPSTQYSILLDGTKQIFSVDNERFQQTFTVLEPEKKNVAFRQGQLLVDKDDRMSQPRFTLVRENLDTEVLFLHDIQTNSFAVRKIDDVIPFVIGSKREFNDCKSMFDKQTCTVSIADEKLCKELGGKWEGKRGFCNLGGK